MLKVTARQIAKHLVKGLPLEGAAFKAEVDEVTKAIDKLAAEQRQALKCAYVFASKVPRQEREDVFQELFTKLLENGATSERLQYVIARCDWVEWWRRYKVRQNYSLDVNLDAEVSETLDINDVKLEDLANRSAEMQDIVTETRQALALQHEGRLFRESFVAQVDFETQIIDKLEARRIWQALPDRVKAIAEKRLLGRALTGAERKYLCLWLKDNRQLVMQS